MRVSKDGKFDALFGASISTVVNKELLPISGYSPSNISSGSYNITFAPVPWNSCTIFVDQTNYIVIGGTQQISVYGKVVADSGSPISYPGDIKFSVPFPVPNTVDRIGGISSVADEEGENIIPSKVYYDQNEPGIILKCIVNVGDAFSSISFSVLITLPISQ